MRLRIVGADAKVPLESGEYVEYANLDYAATAPCLEAVRFAIDEALMRYGSVHRGAGYHSRVTSSMYEHVRAVVHSFVGAGPTHSVIFTRNTTDAMNLLAHAVPSGTTVVVFESEHHATLLAWQRPTAQIVRLPLPSSPEEALSLAASALRDAPSGPRLLAVTAASNVTGELWPIAELAEVAHLHGARIAVDAAQFVPHRPLDMSRLGLDYVAFSGHKLYAPFGAGVLVGQADWLTAAEPYLRGGGAVDLVSPDDVVWSDDPQRRHEAGTPNFVGAVALAAACTALSEAGWDDIVASEERLLHRLRAGLAARPDVNELTLWGSDHPRIGIVTFTVSGLDSPELAQTLADHHGIGVRSGKFCAHLLMRQLIGDAALGCAEGGAIRASFGIGTTDEHIDRLLSALTTAGERAPRPRRFW